MRRGLCAAGEAVMFGQDGKSTAGSCATVALTLTLRAQLFHILYKQHNAFPTHRINARQLHADVDHHDGDHLPAHTAVHEQAAHRQRLDGGQRALLLLHLLDLRLDVSFAAKPLQR